MKRFECIAKDFHGPGEDQVLKYDEDKVHLGFTTAEAGLSPEAYTILSLDVGATYVDSDGDKWVRVS